MRLSLFSAVCLASVSCKSTQVVEPSLPKLPNEELSVISQSLTDVTLKLGLTVEASEHPVRIDKAIYEFVVDGEVLSKGEQPVGIDVNPGQTAPVGIEQAFTYVKDGEGLKAMDARGGALLMALRGKLMAIVLVPSGDSLAPKEVELPFARSKEVRTPRLPHLKLLDPEAGRFSDTEVQVLFRLSVVNSNPFHLPINEVRYEIELAGKKVIDGVQGQGDKISPSASGVYDVNAVMNESTHEKEAKKIVAGLIVPYTVRATLKTALYEEPIEVKGDIKLTKAK